MSEYKKEEIKIFLEDRIKELKEYSKEEYNKLVNDNELHNEIFNTDSSGDKLSAIRLLSCVLLRYYHS